MCKERLLFRDKQIVEIKKRTSDLGVLWASVEDVKQHLTPVQQQIVSVMWNRLLAIRDIVDEG